MPKKDTRDWETIKNEYVTTDISLRDLAARWGVQKTIVGRKCAEGDWGALREKFKKQLAKKRQDSLIKAAVTATHAKDTELVLIAQGMDLEVDRILSRLADEALSPQNRYNLLRSLDIAYRISKDSKGIISLPERERLDMARAELKMKQEEHEKNMAERTVGSEPIKVVFSTEIEGDSE